MDRGARLCSDALSRLRWRAWAGHALRLWFGGRTSDNTSTSLLWSESCQVLNTLVAELGQTRENGIGVGWEGSGCLLSDCWLWDQLLYQQKILTFDTAPKLAFHLVVNYAREVPAGLCYCPDLCISCCARDDHPLHAEWCKRSSYNYFTYKCVCIKGRKELILHSITW